MTRMVIILIMTLLTEWGRASFEGYKDNEDDDDVDYDDDDVDGTPAMLLNFGNKQRVS